MADSLNKGKGKTVVESPDSPHPTTRKGKNTSSEGNVTHSSKKGKNKEDVKAVVEKLKAKSAGIIHNLNTLSCSSLFATVIGNPVDLKEVWKRIKFDWKFVENGFQLIPMENNWFEIKFDEIMDRERMWEARPLHIDHQLVVLKPWRDDFDPQTESIFVLDTWIRFPGLPTKFVSDEVLTSITEDNEIGKVIRVDAFNHLGARRRYPRVCVNIDIASSEFSQVIVVDEKGKVAVYPVWFEDFSKGCGSCGEEDHCFDDCPKRSMHYKKESPLPGMGGNPESSCTRERAGNDEAGEWVRVVSRKKKEEKPVFIGHSKNIFSGFFEKRKLCPPELSLSPLNSGGSSGEESNTVPPAVVSPPRVLAPVLLGMPISQELLPSGVQFLECTGVLEAAIPNDVPPSNEDSVSLPLFPNL